MRARAPTLRSATRPWYACFLEEEVHDRPQRLVPTVHPSAVLRAGLLADEHHARAGVSGAEDGPGGVGGAR
ncbi:hypothetical protein GT045_33900 [Streptomyces sp. SID486]|nr:hypothetical protein [Streptomyces sp. SID486]MYX99662.1 hypothetical protein [Streptomyces sp. SID486]